ncbi:EAL domain-containing response regulator [Achromobacter xylosoxidans]|uniref:Diguanylate phosphodiesterase n=1 Tax=Alcaligenes xylosoxydans xylosoxydans TaxID=85698 RepID=A0A1R1JT88_ALCXX|nr:EAL domain-containing protein [Achromobacter xylosoxidans]OMG86450.1 diguanylate phosphodiesterase [Achromobacter xylosoxidans]BEG74848.1 Protein-glutamate methylesterase/protein-glutamine glutaminase [Achromobacter xylosoxidans]
MYPYRVLIVDDQLLQREYLKSLFHREGLSRVDTAENGAQALQFLDRGEYDLVLSDLLMPELDGVQFIQKLAQRPTTPLLAVISSSPRQLVVSASLVAKALGIRVIDQIFKPARPSAIAGLVAKLKASSRLKAESQISGQLFDRETLLQALNSRKIQAWFQPKMRLADGVVVAAEALVRWVQPDGTVLLPGQFLPALALDGLEQDLLFLMLEQTISAQTLWRKGGFEVEVSVNLPTHLLNDRALPERLHEHVLRLNGRPEDLCLELTEGTITDAISDFYAGACRLRMKGFGLAQDDAGQGHSSLYNLVSTPFTELKIDRSLISRCATDDGALAVVESIVSLGRRLGLNVVAEGLETREQLVLLQRMRCHMAQGFLISHALTPPLFQGFLKKHQPFTL